MSDDRPLPYGWVKEWDQNYQQHFYVDTKAQPTRSIWTHPYDDEQYLREHPDVREKVGRRRNSDPKVPPALDERRPSSYHGESSNTPGRVNAEDQYKQDKEKRSLFGKLKDKAIGTKEEREAARREEQRIMEERRRRAMEAQQQRYAQQGYPQQQGFGGGSYGPAQQGFGRGYGPPPGQYGGYPQQGGYYAPQGAPPRRGGFGGGGMALPLVGGLAGGLLLGEAMDGMDGGGDFGGGDFGGGDFGGGDF